METQNLYRVTKEEELEKVKELLTVCFAEDPLYCYLIPDEDTRKRLLPELFSCDLTEFYETCQIYADSSEINGVLIVSDEAAHTVPGWRSSRSMPPFLCWQDKCSAYIPQRPHCASPAPEAA